MSINTAVMPPFIFEIITNPLSYALPIGGLAAMYAGWSLARRQFLSVNKIFNLITISVLFGWLTGLIIQLTSLSITLNSFNFSHLWVHPRPLVVLGGYIVMALAASRYIRAIRYPYWRTIDMLSAALAILLTFLLLGWSIQMLELWPFVITVGAMASAGVVVWTTVKTERYGLATGLHLATVFVTVGTARLLVPAWQEITTNVEWTAVIIGGVAGVTVMVLRASSRSEKAILQDIPRGVSQSFRDTFSRAFRSKQVTESE